MYKQPCYHYMVPRQNFPDVFLCHFFGMWFQGNEELGLTAAAVLLSGSTWISQMVEQARK